MKKSLLFLITFCLSIGVIAQDGTLYTTFNSTDVGFGYGDGPSDQVYATANQDDGKIIIGGNFTIFKGNYLKNSKKKL